MAGTSERKGKLSGLIFRRDFIWVIHHNEVQKRGPLIPSEANIQKGSVLGYHEQKQCSSAESRVGETKRGAGERTH